MRIRELIVVVIMLFGYTQLFGQENRNKVCIEFRVGNDTLDTTYGGNTEKLMEIITYLNDIKNDSTLDLVEVSFCGLSSPEGAYAINRRLSENRLNALKLYVCENISIPDSIITRCDNAIAWEQLAQLVEQSDMPYKDEAIDVLRNVPEFTYNDKGVLIDSRKKHLMELQYGRTWYYMQEHFFPLVRNASVIFVTVRQKPVVEEIQEQQPELQSVETVDTVPEEQETNLPLTEPEVKKPFYMSVKTNMLYDVLAVPNIGIEFYLGRGWSISGNWMYAWWKSDNKNRYWRLYGGDIVVRKWLGQKASEKPLTGHHIGVYGQAFTYDFEWGGIGYMGGVPGGSLWDSANYAVGVEYGYSLPIAKRLNIDFTIGVGYWGGKYYEYEPLDGHNVWKVTKQRHWFGPTKAEISLVWLLGNGNSNKLKGGIR